MVGRKHDTRPEIRRTPGAVKIDRQRFFGNPTLAQIPHRFGLVGTGKNELWPGSSDLFALMRN
ncbi:hypothetical protein [Burkholderia arboris]|uniref:hypothetical protein n=1 Tax=Burkholderia arboris TaxID=488730 RepID=UPI001CF542C8|nr:hypothetical protein [Burkholderia arboris]MCA8493575.1 hypothetical protein [Burkholderia arboris]